MSQKSWAERIYKSAYNSAIIFSKKEKIGYHLSFINIGSILLNYAYRHKSILYHRFYKQFYKDYHQVSTFGSKKNLK
jgi:hypothetical protein